MCPTLPFAFVTRTTQTLIQSNCISPNQWVVLAETGAPPNRCSCPWSQSILGTPSSKAMAGPVASHTWGQPQTSAPHSSCSWGHRQIDQGQVPPSSEPRANKAQPQQDFTHMKYPWGTWLWTP